MSTTYRLYADDSVIHEDKFEEMDHALPYYDDYLTVEIPDAVMQHIIATMPHTKQTT